MSKLTVLGLSSYPVGPISGRRPPEVSPISPAACRDRRDGTSSRRRCLSLAVAAVAANAVLGVEPATAQDARVTIADASATEGNSITFTVTLSGQFSEPLKVTPSFSGGTATEGTDYTANTAGIDFLGNDGEAKTFTVATTQDAVVEADETFTVTLTVSETAEERFIAVDRTATGTIDNDDTATLTIAGDASAAEGDDFTFTLSVNNAVSGGFTAFGHFRSGTATAEVDYEKKLGPTAHIPFAGLANETHTVSVATIEDSESEADETFSLSPRVLQSQGLLPGGVRRSALVTDDFALLTILDDDTPRLTIEDASASEGDAITFTATLDKAVSGGLTVTPSFTGGTATKGTDYTENTTALNFAGTAGETRSFTVETTEDTDVETDETFTVGLAVSGTSATVTATDTATGTITDDPPTVPAGPPAVIIADASAEEGDGITFTVALDGLAPGGLTVTPSFTDGTAEKGVDYTANTAALTFTGMTGETKSFTVTTTEDEVVEAGETFTVGLTVSGTSATVTGGPTRPPARSPTTTPRRCGSWTRPARRAARRVSWPTAYGMHLTMSFPDRHAGQGRTGPGVHVFVARPSQAAPLPRARTTSRRTW